MHTFQNTFKTQSVYRLMTAKNLVRFFYSINQGTNYIKKIMKNCAEWFNSISYKRELHRIIYIYI